MPRLFSLYFRVFRLFRGKISLIHPSSFIIHPSQKWADSQTNYFIFSTHSHFSQNPRKHWRFFMKPARFRTLKNRLFRQIPVSQKRELSIFCLKIKYFNPSTLL